MQKSTKWNLPIAPATGRELFLPNNPAFWVEEETLEFVAGYVLGPSRLRLHVFFMENMKGKHAVEEPAVGGFGHFLATAPTTMATLWMKYSAAHVRKCLPWEVVNISNQTHRSITELVFGSFRVVFKTLCLMLLSIRLCVFA